MTRSRQILGSGLWIAALLTLVVLAWPVGGQQNFLISLANGVGIDTQKSASLTNFTAASTLTARGQLGVQLAMKPATWSVVSYPAANSQATASIAAEAATRHVIDCIGWSAASAAAVTAADGNLAIRDGATGAGTIIWQMGIAHGVAAGAGIQTILPNSICGLNLTGSTNTAMTGEFNAGVTGEHQSVNISGINVQ